MEKLIRTSFIDIDADEVIAVSDIHPEQLPESFEARTYFNLGGYDWEVIKAEPMTASEYMESEQLTLTIRKVTIVKGVDPNTLVFSLPTISNELPPIQEGSTKLNKRVFEMHEDDWRQWDILPWIHADAIDRNFAAIKNIYDNYSNSHDGFISFNKLHVREGLDNPFEGGQLKLSLIYDDFSHAEKCEGVSFSGVAGVVKNGFAVNLHNGLVLYGVSLNDNVLSFSVFPTNYEEMALEELADVLSKYHLCIVDWCSMKMYKK